MTPQEINASNIIEGFISEPYYQKILQNEEYHFQKLVDLFNEYKAFPIEPIRQDLQAFVNLRPKKHEYQTLLDENPSGPYHDFIVLVGKMIAIFDDRGYNKRNGWNPYPDARTISRSNVRQPVWTFGFFKYKLDGLTPESLEDQPTPTLRYAIQYLKNPGNAVGITSDGHRQQVKSYFRLKSDAEILTLFPEVSAQLRNVNNRGFLITALLYNPAIKNLWRHDNLSHIEFKPETIESIVLPKIPNTMSKFEHPLNQILYGPPGTGKTYHTVNKALEIIDGSANAGKTREEMTQRFRDLMIEGRIDFTTFHQSMSYEDFIEGIKPQTPGEGESLHYEIESGIFKRLCERAKTLTIEKKTINWDKARFYKMSLGGKGRQDMHQWCIDNNVIALGWGGQPNLKDYLDITDWAQYRDKFAKQFKELVAESRYNIQATYAFIHMKVGDIVVVSKGNHVVDAIGVVTGPYYWDDKSPVDFYHFRKVEWLAKDMNMPPDRFVRKQISQQSIYEFYSVDVKREAFKELAGEDSNGSPKPYVLIIDEINRGNVSQIFGELITLIEKDKRLNEEEALQVTLPYSKEKFGVPSNLYIIGTMNTADRSVEALDSALRRRFCFEEMPPRPELLNPAYLIWDFWWKHEDYKWEDKIFQKYEDSYYEWLGVGFESGERERIWDQMVAEEKKPEQRNLFKHKKFTGINLQLLLETLNNRLEVLKGKDHQIGHSFFMGVDSLSGLMGAFRDKILPLLQEYFYGDMEKLRLVLGDGFFDTPPVVDGGTFASSKHADPSGYYDQKIHRLKAWPQTGDDTTDFKAALNKLMNIPEKASADA